VKEGEGVREEVLEGDVYKGKVFEKRMLEGC